MEDKAEEERYRWATSNTQKIVPSGKVHQPPAAVWKTVKQLWDVTLMGKRFSEMGKRFSDDDGRAVYQFTNVCVRCCCKLTQLSTQLQLTIILIANKQNSACVEYFQTKFVQCVDVTK